MEVGPPSGAVATFGIQITEDGPGNKNSIIADNTVAFQNATTTFSPNVYLQSVAIDVRSGSSSPNPVDFPSITGNNIVNGAPASSGGPAVLAASATPRGIGLGLGGTSTANSATVEGNNINMPAVGSGTSSTDICVGSESSDAQVGFNKLNGGTGFTPVSDAGTRSRIFTHEVTGSHALTSASPSTVTITLAGGDVYQSSTTYTCNIANQTTAADALKIVYSSGTAFVITGPATVSDTVQYDCHGY